MRVPTRLSCFALLALGAGVPAATFAANVSIEITDRDGKPVPNVAISVRSHAEAAAGHGPGATGSSQMVTMNQKNLAFEPHLLIVESGTEVWFPNADDVRHHVYSFAKAKRFDMTIDSGTTHSEPIEFDTPGIITLGCNIHDDMLAYILVVDTPYFGKTGGDGTAEFELEPGHYTLSIWTPRMPPRSQPEAIDLVVTAEQNLNLSHRIENKLYPSFEPSESSLEWRNY